jgi:phosphoesterase RecJ-like protein
MIDQVKIDAFEQYLAQAKKIVILTHMAPDGDAMGSALGMYHYVKAGRSAHVIVPNEFPAFYAWMPGAQEIMVYEKCREACDAVMAEADLIICTDFNDPKRIGPAGEKLVAQTCPKILMDHHPFPVDFADLTFSDPEASSASEIVYRLLSTFNFQLSTFSEAIATCLYTGIMTDTGNFSFNSTRAELYEIVADLVRAGAQKDAIYNAIYNQHTENRMRLWGYALYRKMRVFPEYHAALITLDADELDRYHHQVGDTEGLVNMPLQIADVYYSVFIREERAKPGTPHSRIRLSFRSQGDRPVNIFANEIFHGGGHANAAGGELFGTVGQAVRLFERHMAKYLKRD